MAVESAVSEIGAFFSGLAVVGTIIYHLLAPGAAKRAAKEANERAAQLNSQALKAITQFSAEVLFVGGVEESGIGLDIAANRFAIVHPDKDTVICSFDDVVSVHLERDGETVHQTDRGSQVAGAAVGAALLGGIGLIVGGLTGMSRTTRKISKLSLKIYTTDVRAPVADVVFFARAKAVGPDDLELKARAAQAEEWYARFQAILRGPRTHTSLHPATSVERSASRSADV